MTTDPILKRISVARTALILDHPFFGALALRMTPQASDRSQTMGTDGRTLFYNPEFVKGLTNQELIGLLAHEVMHPAMQHHVRREGRDPDQWNRACDFAINPMLVESGFALPKGGCIDPAYAGLSAEQIFARLEQLPKQEQNAPGGNQPGAGNEPGGDQPAPGEVFDAPDPATDAAEWQVAVKQATQAAEMMGHMPAGMKREIALHTKPKVDWKSLLRRFVQECASADYSWKLPNRRYVAMGAYLPSLRSEQMPPLAIAVDTSGSITDEVLAAFEAEIQSIAGEMQPEAVHVIYCDADISSVEVFERGEPIKLTPQGGGGTDFRPPFKHIETEGLTPCCLVYLTDLCGSFPQHAPEYPTLWASTTKAVAPWGETVELEL